MSRSADDERREGTHNRLGGQVGGSAVQARDIGQVTINSAAPERFVPHLLPLPPAHFINQRALLDRFGALVAQRRDGGRPLVLLVSGAQGVGKTGFALRAADDFGGGFPDGRLYADLAEHRLGGAVDVLGVLRRLLRGLAVPAERIDAWSDDLVGLYRTVTHGRRLLLVIDNAEQYPDVKWLLPSSPHALVVVVGRTRLAELVSEEAAVPLVVAPLTPADGGELLARMADLHGVGDEVERLAELCGGLPVALRSCASRLRRGSRDTVAELLALLADERRRLGALSIDAVFDAAYADLAPPLARFYRRLGLLAGKRLEPETAGVIAGTTADEARGLLRRLADAYLVEADGDDRWYWHDLRRLHARQRGEAEDPVAERDAAERELVRWYLDRAAAVDRLVSGGRWRLGGHDDSVQPFAGAAEASAWIDAELPQLEQAVRTAHRHGWHELVWRLVEVLWPVYHARKNYTTWIEAHELAVDSARRCGHDGALARMLNQLTRAYHEQAATLRTRGRGERAAALLEQAGGYLAEARSAADRSGGPHVRAAVLDTLALVRGAHGDLPGALAALDESEALYTGLGDRRGVAFARYERGKLLAEHGRAAEAIPVLDSALDALPSGDRSAACRFRLRRAEARRALGELDAAEYDAGAARAAAQGLGRRELEVTALRLLGAIAAERGDAPAAERYLREALAVAEAAGSPQLQQLRDHFGGSGA
ncbi:hypothetical protein [Allonocardiopsis opalescens]|uniref:NB-ARC domain-containing protein n=1 Tax=Allonocardiopsis opalescens TaxID=1144618 RepID=A0A2T0QFF4_9ACTN|nr:hypothetical protein [Allonocardiopsis opalescens]PRY02581.1 hypothetical protein CLV72_1011184 [Allonocardiopsis opalescens]